MNPELPASARTCAQCKKLEQAGCRVYPSPKVAEILGRIAGDTNSVRSLNPKSQENKKGPELKILQKRLRWEEATGEDFEV